MERLFLIGAIVWAIGFIVFAILAFSGSSTWLQMLSLGPGGVGALGSWISVLTGATHSLQREMLRRQDRLLRRQDLMLKQQDRMLRVLEEIRDRLA